ncbi:MAG: nuclease-related domain-containing protein [Patescibacteria group bacterium]
MIRSKPFMERSPAEGSRIVRTMKKYTKHKVITRLLIGIPALMGILVLAVVVPTQVFIFHDRSYSKLPLVFLDVLLFGGMILAFSEASRYVQGELGEIKIGNLLSKLPSRVHVLKNLVLNEKYGNIDYVVVDTKGIVVIEVKSHLGRILFQGGRLWRRGRPFKKDFLRQVHGQVSDIRKELKKIFGADVFIHIQPIIVFSDPFARMRFGMKPLVGTDVIVIKSEWINNVVLGRKGFLQSSQRVEQTAEYLQKFSQE